MTFTTELEMNQEAYFLDKSRKLKKGKVQQIHIRCFSDNPKEAEVYYKFGSTTETVEQEFTGATPEIVTQKLLSCPVINQQEDGL